MTKTRRSGFRKKRRRGGRKTIKRRGGRRKSSWIKRRGGKRRSKRYRGGSATHYTRPIVFTQQDYDNLKVAAKQLNINDIKPLKIENESGGSYHHQTLPADEQYWSDWLSQNYPHGGIGKSTISSVNRQFKKFKAAK